MNRRHVAGIKLKASKLRVSKNAQADIKDSRIIEGDGESDCLRRVGSRCLNNDRETRMQWLRDTENSLNTPI